MPELSTHETRPLLRIRMAAEQVSLIRLAEAITDLAEREGWAPDLCFQIDLVLEELVQNVISYGYPDGRLGEVNVSIDTDSAVLRMKIEDDGSAFDPLSLPDPDVEAPIAERDVGGLGIHFARTLTDEQQYNRINGRNCVELIKRLSNAGD